ncbi:restriction endonuclease [Aequorivita flava]|uniref:Restriction endonuclease n=1 Tax=Aequorivita flava TaxID=3114371 RepID=A0AB35YWJ0_9FLAO
MKIPSSKTRTAVILDRWEQLKTKKDKLKIITNSAPETWQDLQHKVGEILEQCGFQVEIEKSIKSVRGKVEIDVYAEENIKSRKYSIICECKHWKSKIPQNVVHGFRTVLSDLGANIGIIITTSDFQSGSIESADMTNIKLLSWEDFQMNFFESWYSNYFYTTMNVSHSVKQDYNLVPWFDDLNEEDKSKYNKIRNKLNELSEIQGLFPLSILLEMENYEYEFPTLPLKNKIIDFDEYYGDLPLAIFKASDYESFLKIFTNFGKEVVREFNELDIKYKSESE